jgi:hypothetical protein
MKLWELCDAQKLHSRNDLNDLALAKTKTALKNRHNSGLTWAALKGASAASAQSPISFVRSIKYHPYGQEKTSCFGNPILCQADH